MLELLSRPPAAPYLLVAAARRRGAGPALRLLGEASRLAGFEDLHLAPLDRERRQLHLDRGKQRAAQHRQPRRRARVAGGRSNKQVAATLFLSEGTIENTLTRVYAKLGVRSRTQLTRALTAA